MTAPQTLRLDAGASAPPGVRTIVGDLFRPEKWRDPPIVFTCLPGGGMSRRYFDLAVAHDPGTYSMARFLAGRGFGVATLDPPGVGDSDVPDDGWTLTPETVAAVCGAAVGQLTDGLRRELPGLVSVGVGHSAGALLTVYQQADFVTHDALVLLGFAGGGLPGALSSPELLLAGGDDTELAAVRREIVELARARFTRPLPRGRTGPSAYLIGVPVPDAALDGIALAGAPLLAVVGLTSMIPGASADKLAAIEVPVFLGVGQHDITGPAGDIPAQFPAATDITLSVLAGSGHNHHVAPTRLQLWNRMAAWAVSLFGSGDS